MDIEAIATEIRDRKTNSLKGDVSGVWNAILSWGFDVFEGCITQPQAKHTRLKGKGIFALPYPSENRDWSASLSHHTMQSADA